MAESRHNGDGNRPIEPRLKCGRVSGSIFKNERNDGV